MRKTHLILLFFLTAVLVSSCVRDDFPKQSAGEVPAQTEKEGSVRSGRLPNPYSVANMQRAYESLTGLPSTRAGGLLDPDHYHVRFVPFDDDQYYELTADESIDFYPYPLDADVPEGAISYLDDLQAEDAPPVLYACVPVDYVFPAGVPYEIIEDLILAGMDEEETGTSGDGGITIGQITLMSGGNLVPDIDPLDPLCPGVGEVPGVFTCERPETYTTDPWTPPTEPDDPDDPGTGEGEGDPRDPVGGDGSNIGELPIPGGNPIDPGLGGTSNYGRPYGYIRVWDDLLQAYVPLEGVKVKMKVDGLLFKKRHTAITDATGYFRIEHYMDKNDERDYQIVWETDHYDIRDGMIGQAFYNSRNVKSNVWNLDIGGIDNTNLSQGIATMHRAAYRYFYGNTGGLKDLESLLLTHLPWRKLKMVYYGGHGRAKAFEWYSASFPKVIVFRYNTRWERQTTRQIFSTTSHELGHVAHYYLMNTRFFNVNYILVESWASFTEWWLTLLEYGPQGYQHPDITSNNWERSHWLGYQGWPYTGISSTALSLDDELEYSSLFIDLVDDFNQSTNNGLNTYPTDEVTGYTPTIINNMLNSMYAKSSVETQLKANKPIVMGTNDEGEEAVVGVTDEQIDNLLARYFNHWVSGWL